jgi:hypothetical protein
MFAESRARAAWLVYSRFAGTLGDYRMSTKAKAFASRMRTETLPPDSLDQFDHLITILNLVDPTAMFDLEVEQGMIVIFTDGSRATVLGPEIN